MNGSDPKQTARDLLTEAHPALVGLSHWIHANPELAYEEVLASGWVAEWLTTAGFEVEAGVGGLDTAVRGTFGPGPFHVVLCAEYDALPTVGHACGHNVMAAASIGAGIALASVADELGLRVTVLGTPAEEGGGGKIRLIDAGAFDGAHAAMMVHAWPSDIAEPEVLAIRTLKVTYTGREAHAAAYPEKGVNAADAMVVAQAAIGLLRQQLLPTDRVHGIVTKGGDAPNIVPAETTATFMTRASTRERLAEVTERVRRCFEAGALATGADLTFVEDVAYADMRHDHELAQLYRRNAEELGRTFSEEPSAPISTDMGDVSHVVASIHPTIGIDAGSAVNHQHAFAAAAVSPSADQAIYDGALALAWTAIDAAQDSALRARLMGVDAEPLAESWVSMSETVDEAGLATVTQETITVTEMDDGAALVERETVVATELSESETLLVEHDELILVDEETGETVLLADTGATGVMDAEGDVVVVEAFDMSDAWATTDDAGSAAEPAAEIVAEERAVVAEPAVAEEVLAVAPVIDDDGSESFDGSDTWSAEIPTWMLGGAAAAAESAEVEADAPAMEADAPAMEAEAPAMEAEAPAMEGVEAAGESVGESESMEWLEPATASDWQSPIETSENGAEPVTDMTETEPVAAMEWLEPEASSWSEPASAEAEPVIAEPAATDSGQWSEQESPSWEEPVAQAEQVAEAEPVAESEAQPWSEQVAGTESETASWAEPVADAEPTVETEAPSWAEPVAEAEPQAETASWAEPVADAEPTVETEAPSWAEPVADAEPQAETESWAEPVADAEPTVETEAPSWAEPVAEAEPTVETEDPSWAEPVAEAEPTVETEAPSWAEPVADAESTVETEASSWADPVPEAEPQAETASWTEQAAEEETPSWSSVADAESVEDTPSWTEQVAGTGSEPETPSWTDQVAEAETSSWSESVAEAEPEQVAEPETASWVEQVAEAEAVAEPEPVVAEAEQAAEPAPEPVVDETQPAVAPRSAHDEWDAAFAELLGSVETTSYSEPEPVGEPVTEPSDDPAQATVAEAEPTYDASPEPEPMQAEAAHGDDAEPLGGSPFTAAADPDSVSDAWGWDPSLEPASSLWDPDQQTEENGPNASGDAGRWSDLADSAGDWGSRSDQKAEAARVD